MLVSVLGISRRHGDIIIHDKYIKILIPLAIYHLHNQNFTKRACIK